MEIGTRANPDESRRGSMSAITLLANIRCELGAIGFIDTSRIVATLATEQPRTTRAARAAANKRRPRRVPRSPRTARADKATRAFTFNGRSWLRR